MTAVVLLTGFEPFGGHRVNASWLAVQEVARRWIEPTPLVTLMLPVSFRRAPEALRRAVAEHRPRLVVCVGEAGGRTAVGLERVAANLVETRSPDNDGAVPARGPVVTGGALELASSLPLDRCLAAVRAVDVPVELSPSAGTYVCNATFYTLLRDVGTATRAGFVHVPRVPGQAAGSGTSMTTADAARALLALVHAALRPT